MKREERHELLQDLLLLLAAMALILAFSGCQTAKPDAGQQLLDTVNRQNAAIAQAAEAARVAAESARRMQQAVEANQQVTAQISAFVTTASEKIDATLSAVARARSIGGRMRAETVATSLPSPYKPNMIAGFDQQDQALQEATDAANASAEESRKAAVTATEAAKTAQAAAEEARHTVAVAQVATTQAAAASKAGQETRAAAADAKHTIDTQAETIANQKQRDWEKLILGCVGAAAVVAGLICIALGASKLAHAQDPSGNFAVGGTLFLLGCAIGLIARYMAQFEWASGIALLVGLAGFLGWKAYHNGLTATNLASTIEKGARAGEVVISDKGREMLRSLQSRSAKAVVDRVQAMLKPRAAEPSTGK